MNLPSYDPPFVGESRFRIVEMLMETFDKVNADGTPRWISLEAPSGWGKTRIGREFYSSLASRRQLTRPGYWPLSMFENQEINLAEVSAKRKIVFPHVVHVPGTLPNFAWWGITCSRRGGISTHALASDLGQFEAHAPYLEDAWRNLRPKRERLKTAIKKVGAAVGEEVASETVEAMLGAVGATVPGLGLVEWVASVGMDQVRARSARKERLLSSEAITQNSGDLVDETLEKLCKLSRPGLPLVIFIEDFHCADSDTALTELLSGLMESQSAVLLITSALPGHLSAAPNLRRLLLQHASVIDRIRPMEELGGISQSKTPAIQQLSHEDLRCIVKQYYPQVDPETESHLARRYTNPLMLEMVCTRPLYRNKFPEGDLCLTVDEINKMPSDLYGLYLQQWNELPEDLRYALSLASHCTPQLISAAYGCPPTWHLRLANALLNEMHRRNPRLSRDKVAAALQDSVVAYSWAQRTGPMLLEFTDPDQRAIAYGEEMLDTGAELETALAKIIYGEIREGVFTTREEEDYAAWTILSLHRAGRGGDSGALADACLHLLDALEIYPRELPCRIDMARYALGHVENNSLSRRKICLHLALALHEQGQIGEAISLLEELVDEWEDACGPNDTGVLGAKVQLTSLYRTAGRLDDAMHLGSTILYVYQGIPEFAGEVFAVIIGLAQALGLAGRKSEAVQIYTTLLKLEPSLKDRSFLWPVRDSLAQLMGDLGDLSGAIKMTEALLSEQKQDLDNDSLDVLVSRHNLYALKFKSNDEEAVELFRGLLEDCGRLLGQHHPQTAKVRNAMITCQGERESGDNVIIELEKLLEDQSGSLSADHPDILVTRNNIAVFSLRYSDRDHAIRLYESLLQDQENILGATNPATCATRNDLLWIYEEDGRLRDIVRVYKSLFAYQVERLGLGHDDVDETRSALSTYLEDVGEIEEAVGLYESYLAHQLNLHGADHPDVQYARDIISGFQKRMTM